MDTETLLFGDENDIDCEYGNFEVKFEMEGFDDLELLKAVELIESQELPAGKPVDEIDAVRDTETDHSTLAPGLLRSQRVERDSKLLVRGVEPDTVRCHKLPDLNNNNVKQNMILKIAIRFC